MIRDKCGRISERTLPKIPISQKVPRLLNVSAQLNSPRLISYPSTLQVTLTTCLFGDALGCHVETFPDILNIHVIINIHFVNDLSSFDSPLNLDEAILR